MKNGPGNGFRYTNLYRYDLGGLTTNIVYPDGKTVRYGFDPIGNVTNITDWANHTWRITRDAAGRISTLAYPNNVSGSWGYDASGAVTNWIYTGGSGLPGRRITRDAMGLKTREDVTGLMPVPSVNRRAVNTFNDADRLVSAQVTLGTNALSETYLYDGCGALTNIVRSVGTNDLFTYDLAGRMISATVSNLSLLVSYDALENRVKTTVNGTTRLWVIDHTDPLKRPLMETTTNGTPVQYFIWGAGRLLAVIDADGTTRYAHCDDFGSVVVLSDVNGAVLFTANYGPYGEPWGTSGTNATPFGWLGGYGVFHADGSSLYLTRHRVYDTMLKRFLSQDPIGLGGGANLYCYALGNPLSFVDPLGLCGESVAGAVVNSLGDYFTSGDYSQNLAKGCETVLYSPYNAVMGLASFANNLLADPKETLNGTFNNPGNAIQNFSLGDWMSDPKAVAGSIWGGGLLAAGLTPAAADTTSLGMTTVSRWGREGLQPGDWVMNGPATPINYLLSGKYQPTWVPTFGQAPNIPASFSGGMEFNVPASSVVVPPGIEGAVKSLLNQRMYRP
jgi:RHS repeat-associated protein